MKKKLFLFITCFFLCSSVIIFFSFRNRQSAEITKNGKIIDKNDNENVNVNEKNNENDNDKVNKKEENKDKPIEIKNEEEKKPEEKDNVDQNNESKNNQEETDDLPWMFTWKGTVPAVVVSDFLAYGTYKLISICYPSLQFNDANGWRKFFSFNTLLFVLILLVFQQVFSPLLLAMKGYKNKSYWERFKFIGKKIFWTCVKFIGYVLLIVIIITLLLLVINKVFCQQDQQDDQQDNNSNP